MIMKVLTFQEIRVMACFVWMDNVIWHLKVLCVIVEGAGQALTATSVSLAALQFEIRLFCTIILVNTSYCQILESF